MENWVAGELSDKQCCDPHSLLQIVSQVRAYKFDKQTLVLRHVVFQRRGLADSVRCCRLIAHVRISDRKDREGLRKIRVDLGGAPEIRDRRRLVHPLEPYVSAHVESLERFK